MARLAHLPHRRLRRASGDEAVAALRLPRARAARREQRDGRAPASPTTASADRYLGMLAGDARRVGARRTAFRARARGQRWRWTRTPGSRTPTTSTHGCCSRAAENTGAGRRPLLGEADRLARIDRDARRFASGSDCARRAGRLAPACPTALSGTRGARSCDSIARGLSNREIGADAVHQRAHRRQPRAEHPCARPTAPTAPRRRPTRTVTALLTHSCGE